MTKSTLTALGRTLEALVRDTVSRGKPGPTRAPYFPELEAAARAGFHVMLMGPRGSGKTTAVRALAELHGRRLRTITCHADMGTDELRGTAGLREGNSTFLYSPLVEAARDGDYVLLDEANLARPGVTAWLNPALDDPGLVSIPETGEAIPVADGFRAFLCFNAGYHGARELNQALVDRCRVLYCGYWPEADEKRLLAARLTGLADADLTRMLRVAHGVREARRKGSVDFDFSPRTLIQWGADARDRGVDLPTAFKAVVLPKVGDPQEYGPQLEALEEIARLVFGGPPPPQK
jgi:nitric oxide reductase NorQ protein